MMHQAKKTGTLLLPPLFLLLFLLATDPYKLPLVLIVIPFLLVGLTVFLIVKSILGISPLPETKVRLIAAIMTALATLLLVFQSLHQLSIRDFLIVVALLVGLTLYLRRIDV